MSTVDRFNLHAGSCPHGHPHKSFGSTNFVALQYRRVYGDFRVAGSFESRADKEHCTLGVRPNQNSEVDFIAKLNKANEFKKV